MTNSLLPPGRNSWEFDNIEEPRKKPKPVKDCPPLILSKKEKEEVRRLARLADDAQLREYEQGFINEWELN